METQQKCQHNVSIPSGNTKLIIVSVRQARGGEQCLFAEGQQNILVLSITIWNPRSPACIVERDGQSFVHALIYYPVPWLGSLFESRAVYFTC